MPKNGTDGKSLEEQIAEAAPTGSVAYRVFLDSGVRYPIKDDLGSDHYAIGDYPIGTPPGMARIIFLDSSGKQIQRKPQLALQIGPTAEPRTDARPYQTVEEKEDDTGEPPISNEADYLIEINKQEIRRQRLFNIGRARRLSRTDAMLETMHGLVSDTLSNVGRIDEVSRRHHEAQLELTDKILELARKAGPPPPPPDWPGMFEKITGHLSTVVVGAMRAREALPAGSPAALPSRAASLDELRESFAEASRRTDRLEAMLQRILERADEPEPRTEAKPEPRTEAKPEPRTEAKPEPRTEAKPEPRTEAKPEPTKDHDSDDPPSPPPVSSDVSSPTPEKVPTIAPNAYRVAWNRVKRMVAKLTDGDIVVFIAQPQMAVLFLGMLASMMPGGGGPPC